MDSQRRGPGAIEIIVSSGVVILIIWPFLKMDRIHNKKRKTDLFFPLKKQKPSEKNSGVQRSDNDGASWNNGWVLFETYNEWNRLKWIKWIKRLKGIKNQVNQVPQMTQMNQVDRVSRVTVTMHQVNQVPESTNESNKIWIKGKKQVNHMSHEFCESNEPTGTNEWNESNEERELNECEENWVGHANLTNQVNPVNQKESHAPSEADWSSNIHLQILMVPAWCFPVWDGATRINTAALHPSSSAERVV